MRISRIALASAVVLGGILIPAPAVASPIAHTATSIFSGITSKSVTVHCPAGTSVFGIGGRINGDSGSVVLTAIMPDISMSSVTASGHSRPGYTGRWSITVRAVCMAPGLQQPERVITYGFTGNAWADCPSGKLLHSSGFYLPNPTGVEYVDEVEANPYYGYTRAHAHATDGSQVTVAAVSVCAYSGYLGETTRRRTAFDTESPKSAIAPPAPWPVNWVFGAGAVIEGGGHVFIDGLGPLENLDGAWSRAVAAKTHTPMALFAAPEPAEPWELETQATNIGSWYG